MHKILFVLSTIVGVYNLLRVQSARCPNIPIHQNFTIDKVKNSNKLFNKQCNMRKIFFFHKYMGRWFEIQKYPFLPEYFQKCVYADLNLNSDGTITIVNKARLFL
jgi:lipocalin